MSPSVNLPRPSTAPFALARMRPVRYAEPSMGAFFQWVLVLLVGAAALFPGPTQAKPKDACAAQCENDTAVCIDTCSKKAGKHAAQCKPSCTQLTDPCFADCKRKAARK